MVIDKAYTHLVLAQHGPYITRRLAHIGLRLSIILRQVCCTECRSDPRPVHIKNTRGMLPRPAIHVHLFIAFERIPLGATASGLCSANGAALVLEGWSPAHVFRTSPPIDRACILADVQYCTQYHMHICMCPLVAPLRNKGSSALGAFSWHSGGGTAHRKECASHQG